MKESFTGKNTTRSIVVAAILLLDAIYFLFDPASSRWMPKCVFHSLTGWDCPGCGSQRLLHALLHLDFRAAWEANALLLCAIPYLIFWGAVEFSPRNDPRHPHFSMRLVRLRHALNSTTAIILISVILSAWLVIRNLFSL